MRCGVEDPGCLELLAPLAPPEPDRQVVRAAREPPPCGAEERALSFSWAKGPLEEEV